MANKARSLVAQSAMSSCTVALAATRHLLAHLATLFTRSPTKVLADNTHCSTQQLTGIQLIHIPILALQSSYFNMWQESIEVVKFVGLALHCLKARQYRNLQCIWCVCDLFSMIFRPAPASSVSVVTMALMCGCVPRWRDNPHMQRHNQLPDTPRPYAGNIVFAVKYF